MNPKRLSGAILLCLLLAACSQAESRDAATPSDKVIGILQCDEYLAAVETCIRDTVPAAERAALTADAHQTYSVWKEAYADPQKRTSLPQACAISHEVAREQFARFGCAL